MLPDRVSNPGPLTYESGGLPIALRGIFPFDVLEKPCVLIRPAPEVSIIISFSVVQPKHIFIFEMQSRKDKHKTNNNKNDPTLKNDNL